MAVMLYFIFNALFFLHLKKIKCFLLSSAVYLLFVFLFFFSYVGVDLIESNFSYLMQCPKSVYVAE